MEKFSRTIKCRVNYKRLWYENKNEVVNEFFSRSNISHLQINCWNTKTSERPTPEILIKSLTHENGDTK